MIRHFHLCRLLTWVWVALFFTHSAAFGQELSLESVIGKALEHSYDLRISHVDKAISETGVMEARSQYFPQIKGRLTTEYQRDLRDDESIVTTVGDTVIPAGTRFQNNINLSITHTVFNFGIRRKQVQIAKADVAVQDATIAQTIRNLKLDLLERYTNALQTFNALQANREILPLKQQVYLMNERLYEAGEMSRVTVAEEAIQLARTLSEQNNLQAKLQKQLRDISFYTKEDYSVNEVSLTPLRAVVQMTEIALDENILPETLIYDLEIAKKEKELEIQKREWLPQLVAYGYYNLFGFDPDSAGASYTSIRNRSVSAGLFLHVPVFDGFRNLAEVKRKALEIEKLELEKAKKLAEVRKEYESAHLLAVAYQAESESRADVAIRSSDKLVMEERLSMQELLDRISVLKQRVEFITHELELRQARTQQQAAMQKLVIIAESPKGDEE